MSQATQVMIDLETAGTGPNGIILSIGACSFKLYDKGTVQSQFYQAINPADQEKYGMRATGATFDWWLRQPTMTQEALLMNQVTLPVALERFSLWMDNYKGPVWAYGATFDHVILQSACDGVSRKNSIHYRQQVCMRGICQTANVAPPAKVGRAHNALDDAVFQAQWLQKIFQERMPLQ